MGSFYQPRSTKGFYSSSDRCLTVNCNDDVSIGFRAASQSEEDNAIISASDNSVLSGCYRAGYLTTEYPIDTSKPGRYTLTAERNDIPMVASVSVAQPLDVRVRFVDYISGGPQGQWTDASACWAASLVWWLSVIDDRPNKTYNDMLSMFAGMWNTDGTLNIPAFQRGIQANNGIFRMKTEAINPATLGNYMGNWPMVIAFQTPATTGHMNVLAGYDSNADLLRAMEPWYPDPGDDGVTWDSSGPPYLNDPNFSFSGIFAYRPLNYYTKPVPGTGVVLIGYPQEYAMNRMP
jgi:hypothetical protein